MPIAESVMPELGMIAPKWTLPDVVTGRSVSSVEFIGKRATLVMFLCNHCPFSQHVQHEVARIAFDYGNKDVGIVAISASDVSQIPDDSPDNLRKMALKASFKFPFCYDESQQVAKAFRAACTPEFFLFDINGALVYRGQLDDSRLGGPKLVTGKDLREALDAILGARVVSGNQKPSVGCNLKWKPGNEPLYTREHSRSHA